VNVQPVRSLPRTREWFTHLGAPLRARDGALRPAHCHEAPLDRGHCPYELTTCELSMEQRTLREAFAFGHSELNFPVLI